MTQEKNRIMISSIKELLKMECPKKMLFKFVMNYMK